MTSKEQSMQLAQNRLLHRESKTMMPFLPQVAETNTPRLLDAAGERSLYDELVMCIRLLYYYHSLGEEYD